MKVKTSELSGAQLDWAVAIVFNPAHEWGHWSPSTDWAQGGPIIERDKISVWARGNEWAAESFVPNQQGLECVGSTPLVAAMRCYVASKLGEEVETPEVIDA